MANDRLTPDAVPRDQRRHVAWLAVLTMAAAPAIAEPPLLNSGHVGAVTALAAATGQQVLLSGGEDGSVRVWSTSTRRIRHHLRIGLHPIDALAVHPLRPLVAVLRRLSAAGAQFELSVWNWRDGTVLFRRQMEGAPLYLGFSSKGSWVMYTLPDWESIVMLDAESGSQRSWPGFGIVSFVATSTNERTLMAYQPGGRIAYWNLATQRESAAFDTVSGLEDLGLSNDKALLVGRSGSSLVAVDVVTGGVAAEVDVDDALGAIDAPTAAMASAVSPARSELVLTGRTRGGEVRVAAFSHRRGIQPTWSAALPGEVSALTLGSRGAYLGVEGRILSVAPFGRATPFSEDELAPITSLAFADGHMVVGGGSEIAVVRSPFFAIEPNTSQTAITPAPAVSLFDVTTPLDGSIDVASPRWLTGADRSDPVWVWNAHGNDGRLGILDVRRRIVQIAPLAFASPLVAVSPQGNMLLAREPSGVLTLLNAVSVVASVGSSDEQAPADEELLAGLVRRQFWTPGVTDATLAGERVLAATARGSELATALVQIDITTTETVPVSDPALLIYDLEHALGTLVTLGIENGRAGPVTVLKQHSGPAYRSKRTIHRVADEELGASLVVDPAGKGFYSSLGRGAVSEWTGARLVDLETSGHQARRLYVIGDRLVALNTDSTVTVWDRATRQTLVDLYLFRDHEWLAATADGVVLSSRGSARYLASL